MAETQPVPNENTNKLRVLQLRLGASLIEAEDAFKNDPTESTLKHLACVKLQQELFNSMVSAGQNKAEEAPAQPVTTDEK